jgi:hypothetical protein
MSGTTDEHKRTRVQYPGTEAGAVVNKRGRPRRVLNELDTSRDELITALATLSKTCSQPSEPAVNPNVDEEIIRLINSSRDTLHELRNGTPYQQVVCEEHISLLRKTELGRSIDPDGKLEDADFLSCFITGLEDSVPPGYKRDFELWPRAPVRVSTYREKWARDAQIAQDLAQLRRQEKARANPSMTPAEPDPGVLNDLRLRIIPSHSATWATLLELALATGIRQRVIRGIIANLRPAPSQAEIVTTPFRHKFRSRGAVPKRYGPRLVLAVLNEFVNRLPQFPIAYEDQKRLRKIAMRTRMVIASRFSRSRSST